MIKVSLYDCLDETDSSTVCVAENVFVDGANSENITFPQMPQHSKYNMVSFAKDGGEIIAAPLDIALEGWVGERPERGSKLNPLITPRFKAGSLRVSHA